MPAILATLASGCGLFTRHVDLTHPDRIAPAEIVSPPKGSIAVSTLGDARTADYATGRQVGQIRETYGIPMLSVEALQDPVVWVSDGLARGLVLRGYEVQRIDSAEPAGSGLVVGGSVVRIFADRYLASGAEILADVWLLEDGFTLSSGRCRGSAGRFDWLGTEDQLRVVLVDALGQFTTECADKIVAAIERAGAASAGTSLTQPAVRRSVRVLAQPRVDAEAVTRFLERQLEPGREVPAVGQVDANGEAAPTPIGVACDPSPPGRIGRQGRAL